MTKRLIALAAAALLAGTARAQTPAPEVTKAQVEQLQKQLDELKSRLEEAEVRSKDAVVLGDVPGSFRIPGSEISLHFYGFVELNWVHAFKADNSDSDYSTFAPYLPLNGSPGAATKNRDYMTLRTTRFGLDTATPTRWGVLVTKIEGDFNNEPRLGNASVYGAVGNVFTQQQTNSYGFRLRHAYGQVGGLLIGQTWSTFMDADNFPETVDYNGPIGQTFIRQPQIRYTYGTPTWGAFTVALENGSSYVLDSTETAMASSHSRLPDLVVRWDRGFEWGAASLRAMTQELRVDDGAGVNAYSRGWGVAGSVLAKFRDAQDTATLHVTYGTGIGRYLNYIEGALYNAAENYVELETAIGVVASYQWKPTDWARVNLVYGMTQNFDNAYTRLAKAYGIDGASPSDRYGINRFVQQGHLGPIFTPIKSVDVGLEAIYASRKTLAGLKGDDFRLNFSAKYYIN